MTKKILVLEDEDNIRSFIVINLKRGGYDTIEFSSGEKAVEYMYTHDDVAVAILAVMLPDIDGYEVCRRIREKGIKSGVIMLTAMSQETDKLTGFSKGADDYVVKPFSVVELLARVDALFRRVWGNTYSSETITAGPFELDTRSRTLKKSGVKVELTQVEYLIMKNFLENKGKALSRDDILKTVWGSEYQGDYKIVDVNIRRLRLKIEEDAAVPKYILTIWGFGYKWENQ